jgi:hypothetical protein
VTDDLDTLKMALLSMCAQELASLHAVHAHVEDWLARPLAAGELEQAIGELEAAGLISAYRRERAEWLALPLREADAVSELRFRTTPQGEAAAFEAWERFFGE